MVKKIIQKYLPHSDIIKQHKNLQFLGERLHQPNLWHLNRYSISLAFAVGLFCAWIPIPGQMAVAAIAAFYLRANLTLSVALVWITNPVTMPPLSYFAYHVGLTILNYPPSNADIEFSVAGLLNTASDIGGVFLLGCLVCAVVSSTLGYYGIRLFWRYHVIKQWRERRKKRLLSLK